MMKLKTFFIYLVSTIPAAALAAYLTSCTSNSTVDQESSAKGACELIVKQSLYNPNSAKIDYKESTAYEFSEKTWRIRVFLHGKNAFNATVPATFECILQDQGDTWKVINVSQI